MIYKWEWSNKLQSEMVSPVDKQGYRFLLTVNPSGEYVVVKFLVKNSFNIPFAQARPNLIAKGWAESVELGKQKAIAAFERFTGITEEEAPVKEVVQEEVIESTPEVIEEVPQVETTSDLEVKFEIVDDKIKVIFLDSDLDQEDVKIKYTTNGKPVQSNSRNYKGFILVEPHTIINLKKFKGEATVEKTVIAEA